MKKHLLITVTVLLLFLPALARGQSNRDVAFVTADPFQCAANKLYYNRVNQKLWGNSNVSLGCKLVSAGSGTSGSSGGGDALTSNPLSQFAGTSSAQLASVLTDETGTGAFVLNGTPTLITPIIASFANATHNHSNGANGGQITDTALAAPVGVPKGGTGGTTAAEARTNLGLAIGTDVQAFDADLATIAGLSPVSGNFIVAVSSQWASVTPSVATALLTNAVADGATKGIAAFNTSDFNSTAGIITIDYINGQAATSGQKGFLTSADWITFNNKVSSGAATSSGLTMNTSRILGRTTASAGNIEEITIGPGLSLSAGVLSNTSSGGTVTVVGSGALASTAIVTGGTTTLIQTPSSTTTIDTNGNISTPGSLTTGAGSTAAGAFDMGQGTAQSLIANTFTIMAPTSLPAGGLGYVVPSTASTGFLFATNVSGVMTITHDNTVARTIASGTSALGTSAISSGACATVVTTSATGTATTDTVLWGFNGDPTGVTGYQATTNGMLTIVAYPSANNVNFRVCNNTSASITPGAITLNWRVAR
nr:putative autotransporter protein [uncultured bacterium]